MIKLKVSSTELEIKDPQLLAEGNINSIFLKLSFSADWACLSKSAVFRNGDTKVCVELSSDKCAVPWEVLSCVGEVFVSLRGTGSGGNVVLCTENKSLGIVSESLAASIAEAHREATPDVIDSLLADVYMLKTSAPAKGEDGKSAYDIAVEYGFEGSEADWLASLKGEDGANGADGYTPVKGTDYWTDADKQGIVSDVLSVLPDGDEVSY